MVVEPYNGPIYDMSTLLFAGPWHCISMSLKGPERYSPFGKALVCTRSGSEYNWQKDIKKRDDPWFYTPCGSNCMWQLGA